MSACIPTRTATSQFNSYKLNKSRRNALDLENVASGNVATVTGGFSNQATADFSFAAGSTANAKTTGSFVWSDTGGQANNLPFSTVNADEFAVRATRGVLFETAIDPTSGQLTSGCAVDLSGNMVCSGTFEGSGDRAMKDGFKPVAASDVVKGVAALPMTSWTFKGQTVRHIGPIAQDFYAPFKVGTDDKHISTTDAQGVALAAIRTLSNAPGQGRPTRPKAGTTRRAGLQIELLIAQKNAERAEQKAQAQSLSARLEKL